MSAISVLVIHNRYRQWGGEDAMVRAEVDDLRSRGHRVILYGRNNREIDRFGLTGKALLPLTAIWNRQTYLDVRSLIRTERPDVAMVHNFFPLISPAAHYACKSAAVPVIQTLHNYRLLCPAATLFADGNLCRRCTQRPTSAIRRGCYRQSRLQTAAVAAMLEWHRLRDSWHRCVDAYFVPSRFGRDYFAANGLPAETIHVKPNFLASDPGTRAKRGEYALFAGRLSPEKGVLEMLRAWEQLADIPLAVVGDGPLREQVYHAARRVGGRVTWLGQLAPERTIEYIKGARFLVFPSRWYEPFGLGLLEVAACGVPAIASRIGAIPEIVADHDTGLLFNPENFDEMAERVRWAWWHPDEMDRMGAAARERYLQRFTADNSYKALMRVCQTLLN